jgi:hypothetical protein
MKTSIRAHVFLVVLAWVTIFPTEAMAYLDPGTGSLIIQSVIAALAAVGFGMRVYWSRIRGWFTRSEQPKPPHDGPPESQA